MKKQEKRNSHPLAWRTIRVFVSSTFRDMHEERNELVKRIFPQLRKLCEQRSVTWGEVDLRWGVTDEQKAEGKVLPICLAEIHRCRPYFIGLLGERYGWIPDEIPIELIEQEPWLAEHQSHSVTELEILHGVLNNPEMADHAFFYFRSPSYIDSLPSKLRPEFREIASSDENQRLGAEEASRRTEMRRHKLAALKERIRNSGLPVRENYHDPQELGQLVLQDLTKVINRLFPEKEKPDLLDRESLEHGAFAANRTLVYIGRNEYFERLNNHARGEGPPLVVLGESGSGKSALLANWAISYQAEHPEAVLIKHFIGASPSSTDCMMMLRRLMGEFQRHYDIRQEIPDEFGKLCQAFANSLHMVAAKGRLVLIIDGLNLLEDCNGAPDLVWLPPVIPENIRLILSTLPGRPLQELKKRTWPTFTIELLREDERRELIGKYLSQYAKTISPDRAARVASAEQTANPLYLRALLDELRLFGIHEQLDERIAYYLAAETIPDLYAKILARYEEDYERERKGLVRDAMTFLWAARRGLSESELLDLLGSNGIPLPHVHWSLLYLAAEHSLVNRSGLLGFFHSFLCEAVELRYLSNEKAKNNAHLCLADYFENRDLDERKIAELPWQLSKARAWQRLYNLLSDLSFFASAWNADDFEVKAFWTEVENNSPFRMLNAYRSVLEAPKDYDEYIWNLAFLLHETGHWTEALSLRTYIVDRVRGTENRVDLAGALCNQALILKYRGDLDRAIELLQEGEQICRELNDQKRLAINLSHQADILYTRGDLDRAMALHERGEQICRRLNNKEKLPACLAGQANILRDKGYLDDALALLKEAEQISRELGNKWELEACLGDQATILSIRGDLNGALALQKEEERICREMGFKQGLAISLGNQALILDKEGNPDGALSLHKEEEQIYRELSDMDGLQRSLDNQALILLDLGDLDGAAALMKEAEQICRNLGNKKSLAACLGNQGLVLKERGDLVGAMALYKEQERIYRKLGYKNGLHVSLDNQGLVLVAQGDLDGAMALHKEAEKICRELGNKKGLAACLTNQALILKDRGDLVGAMELLKEQERLCRELGFKQDLDIILDNQAMIMRRQGDLKGAMTKLKEAEQISREQRNKIGLALYLGHQAVILMDQDDFDGAMVLLKEEERLRRETGVKKDLHNVLINQGRIFREQGNFDRAMALYKEAEQICHELGDKSKLATCLRHQALALDDLGDPDTALSLHKKEEQLYRDLGDMDGVQISLHNQSCILKRWGDLKGAMELCREEERICIKLGMKGEQAVSLHNQAKIYKDWGNLKKAMSLFKKEEKILRELDDKRALAILLGEQAQLFQDSLSLDTALALFKEQSKLFLELEDRKSLAFSILSQAGVLRDMMDLEQAMELYRRAENLCREFNDKLGLQDSLSGQALVFLDRGDLDLALRLFQQEEQLCRELDDKEKLQFSLGNQGLVLYFQGHIDEAMTLFKQQERICRELDCASGLAISLANQARVLAEKMNQYAQALPLAEEAYRTATEQGLMRHAKWIKPILDFARAKSRRTNDH